MDINWDDADWVRSAQNYLDELEKEAQRLEDKLEKKAKGRMQYEPHWNKDVAKKTVQGAVELPNVTIYPPNERCGHDERVNAIDHVSQMAEKGYLKQEEANERIKHIEDSEQKSTLKHLTSDLPPKIYDAPRGINFDWSKPTHFLPVLIGGMGLSAGLAATIPSVLYSAHQWPNTALGLGLGIPALIVGIVGFFICLVTIIMKAPE